MDLEVMAFLIVAGIVVAAWAFGRPRPVVAIDDFVARLSSIVNNAQMTAVQKRHEAEQVYRAHARTVVSLVGAVEDVFPNGAMVMSTASRAFPRVGFDITRMNDAALRALAKGKSLALRARLPKWNGSMEVENLPALLQDPRVFSGGKWYPVQNVFVARKPQ